MPFLWSFVDTLVVTCCAIGCAVGAAPTTTHAPETICSFLYGGHMNFLPPFGFNGSVCEANANVTKVFLSDDDLKELLVHGSFFNDYFRDLAVRYEVDSTPACHDPIAADLLVSIVSFDYADSTDQYAVHGMSADWAPEDLAGSKYPIGMSANLKYTTYWNYNATGPDRFIPDAFTGDYLNIGLIQPMTYVWGATYVVPLSSVWVNGPLLNAVREVDTNASSSAAVGIHVQCDKGITPRGELLPCSVKPYITAGRFRKVEFAADTSLILRVTYANATDACGVCRGDNSTCASGCDGEPWSTAVLDACGVCGGDNSTCTPCAACDNSTCPVCEECDTDPEPEPEPTPSWCDGREGQACTPASAQARACTPSSTCVSGACVPDTELCTGNGTCGTAPGSGGVYACVCDAGYSGPHCDTVDGPSGTGAGYYVRVVVYVVMAGAGAAVVIGAVLHGAGRVIGSASSVPRAYDKL